VFHQVAYQLIVTHCSTRPDPGAFAKRVGIAQSRVQWPKRSQKHAIAIDLGSAEIWLGQSLVNGAKLSRNSSF
jgi:ribosomal protein S16